MNRETTIASIRAAGEDAKRRDPAVGGIVDELVADIVRRLTPTVTHARTRWAALPVVPATCGECEHIVRKLSVDLCGLKCAFQVVAHREPAAACPLRKGAA